MTKEEIEQTFDWLENHFCIEGDNQETKQFYKLKDYLEQLQNKLESINELYAQGVSEIRTSMDFDTKYDITAQVANALIDKIKKPLLEENKKQKEILDILKWYLICRQEDLLNTVPRGLGYCSFKIIEEWLEND